MGQLVELVFEGIDGAKARALATFIVERGQGILDINVDGVAMSPKDMPPRLPGSFEYLTIALGNFRLGDGVEVPNVGIRSFHYDSQFDVEINVDLKDVQDEERFFEAMFEFAQDTAATFGIEMYFAGMEPACDADTRYFTTSTRGPLKMPSVGGTS